MSTGKIKQLAFSEGVTVGTPSEIAALAVGLASYASEAAFVSAEGAAAVGDAFYDTGASAIKYYDGAWKTVASTAAALSNPMGAAGDMIYGGASGTPTNLATGTTAGILHGGNGATPTWSKLVDADVDASAAISGSKLQAASASNAGAVSTIAQTFNGLKTLDDGLAFTQTNTAASGASTSSSTLQHYSEGGWAPALSFSGGNGTAAISNSTAQFTRTGRVVTVTAVFQVTKGTGSGNFNITDLPFASKNTSGLAWLGLFGTDGIGTLSNRYVVAYLGANTSTIQVIYSGSTATNVTAGDLTAATFQVYLTLTYWV